MWEEGVWYTYSSIPLWPTLHPRKGLRCSWAALQCQCHLSLAFSDIVSLLSIQPILKSLTRFYILKSIAYNQLERILFSIKTLITKNSVSICFKYLQYKRLKNSFPVSLTLHISTLKSHTFWENDGFIFIEQITRPFSRENSFCFERGGLGLCFLCIRTWKATWCSRLLVLRDTYGNNICFNQYYKCSLKGASAFAWSFPTNLSMAFKTFLSWKVPWKTGNQGKELL